MKFLNKYLRNPTSLSDYELEDIWVDFKASLMTTCAYTNATKYPFLYDRCQSVLLTVIYRHKHLLLDAEAKLEFWRYINGGTLRRISGEPNNVPFEALPGLILAAYTGGISRTSAGQFLSNPRWVSEAIDYLIDEKRAPVGLFLKGLVLKYGIALTLPPNIRAAERFLKGAISHGVGSAEIELQNIALHRGLPREVSPMHPDHNRYQEWVTNSSLETTTWW